MARSLLAATIGLGLVVTAFALAPTVAAGNPCFHGYTIPPASTGAVTTVSLEPCAFSPTITRVAPGTTVTFTNTSEFNHLITGVGGAWGDREKELAPGASVAFTFAKVGIYPYACVLHPGMSGAIVVESASDAEAAGTRADDATNAATSAGDDGPSATVVGPLAAAGGLGLGLLLARRGRQRQGA